MSKTSVKHVLDICKTDKKTIPKCVCFELFVSIDLIF